MKSPLPLREGTQAYATQRVILSTIRLPHGALWRSTTIALSMVTNEYRSRFAAGAG
jgi:hypothetical protein